MDDLFAYAKRLAPQATDEELWSIKIVRMKTGLSRASVYNYMALGLFPRQRRIGPGRVAWRASEGSAKVDLNNQTHPLAERSPRTGERV
jgi:predicted DNA-binding transcriptional regulator AlpA